MVSGMNHVLFVSGFSLVKQSPVSFSVSFLWNSGSMLGMLLSFQVISGLVLSFNYGQGGLFASVISLTHDVGFGWLFRVFHLNGASLFFGVMYLHVFRGLIYSSYRLVGVWVSGTFLLVFVMISAFLGYTLPFGTMSLWASSVITNLLSTFPYIGPVLVGWLWGGPSVSEATIGFFFSLHYLLPLVCFVVVVVHLTFLHLSGSTSYGMVVYSSVDKIKFYPYFWAKDSLNIVVFCLFFVLVLLFPWALADNLNFEEGSLSKAPLHIKPEWYFLFAYGILRASPSKLGGVLLMVLSVVILLVLCFCCGEESTLGFYYLWILMSSVWVLLTWLGSCSVEPPYYLLAQITTLLYFSSFLFVVLVFYVITYLVEK